MFFMCFMNYEYMFTTNTFRTKLRAPGSHALETTTKRVVIFDSFLFNNISELIYSKDTILYIRNERGETHSGLKDADIKTNRG